MVECSGCNRMVPATQQHECPGGGLPPVRMVRANAPRQVDQAKLREALGMPGNAAAADVAAAVAAYLEPQRPVSAAVARESLIQGAITAGKFPESRRAYWEAQYARDPQGTSAVIGRLAALPEVAAWAARTPAQVVGPVAVPYVDLHQAAAAANAVYAEVYPSSLPPAAPMDMRPLTAAEESALYPKRG